MASVHFTVYELGTGRILSCRFGKLGGAVDPATQGFIPGAWPSSVYRVDETTDPPSAVERDPDPVDLTGLKERAKHQVARWLDWAATPFMGIIPETEKLTYDEKAKAAEATKGEREGKGQASGGSHNFIACEAALVGVSDQVTEGKILQNATRFKIVGPVISGLRQRAGAKIDAATNEAAINAAVEEMKTLFEQITADAAAYAADPRAWCASHGIS